MKRQISMHGSNSLPVVFALIACFVMGCSTSDDRAFRKALDVWHSPTTSVSEKFGAIETLAKHDATAAGLRKLMDSSQRKGLLVARTGLFGKYGTDRGMLEYQFSDRLIHLYFNTPELDSTPDQWTYNYAEIERMTPVSNWTVSTGDIVIIE